MNERHTANRHISRRRRERDRGSWGHCSPSAQWRATSPGSASRPSHSGSCVHTPSRTHCRFAVWRSGSSRHCSRPGSWRGPNHSVCAGCAWRSLTANIPSQQEHVTAAKREKWFSNFQTATERCVRMLCNKNHVTPLARFLGLRLAFEDAAVATVLTTQRAIMS
jgi:hypothetical protein